MRWYVYACQPIDFGWEHLKTVKEVAADILENCPKPKYVPDFTFLQEFLESYNSALGAAKQRGWEGDGTPSVLFLPAAYDNELDFGFIFKQENNGTTFVVSPFELSWLKDFDASED